LHSKSVCKISLIRSSLLIQVGFRAIAHPSVKSLVFGKQAEGVQSNQ
jgi:hypothetical protein